MRDEGLGRVWVDHPERSYQATFDNMEGLLRSQESRLGGGLD